VGPPVSEGGGDGPTGPGREGGDGPRLGWRRRKEAGPKLLLGLKMSLGCAEKKKRFSDFDSRNKIHI
jgi:hypothetical protein